MITVYKNGDERQFHLYEMFKSLGVDVNYSNKDLRGILILPINNYQIATDTLEHVELIFAGIISPELMQTNKLVMSYLKEDFLIENAKLTALGLLTNIIELSQEVISDKSILVLGYGRCGKAICNVLACHKPILSVYTIDPQEQDIAKINDLNVVDEIGYADIVINTIPSIIVGSNEFLNFDEYTLFIDIASNAGGFNKEEALKHDFKIHHLLNIPGKVLPKSAALIIFNAILQLFRAKNI